MEMLTLQDRLSTELKVLDKAIEIIETKGWWHGGTYHPGNIDDFATITRIRDPKICGNRAGCIMGVTIDAAVLIEDSAWTITDRRLEKRYMEALNPTTLKRITTKEFSDGNRAITTYNDYVAKSAKTIINLMKKARAQIVKEMEQANG